MTTLRRATASVLVLVGVGCGLSGCSGQPAVCDDADALRRSVGELKDVKIDANTLDTIRSDLAAVRTDLEQLGKDAKDQYASEIDAVDTQLAGLKASLGTASQTPSAASIGQVVTDVQLVGAAVADLNDAVSGTCD